MGGWVSDRVSVQASERVSVVAVSHMKRSQFELINTNKNYETELIITGEILNFLRSRVSFQNTSPCLHKHVTLFTQTRGSRAHKCKQP